MKKKQIGAVPYITVPGTVKDKNVKYIAVTALKDIAGESHIILEVYRNRKADLRVPVVRYTATEKDWIVYFPDTNTWTGTSIYQGSRPCWEKEKPARKWESYKSEERKNILLAPADLDRIRDFCRGIKIYRESRWWEYFEQHERTIRTGRRIGIRERRKERLQERIADTPELKQQEILEWASKRPFFSMHYLYYRKRSRYADICCSVCGKVSSGKWKRGETFESQYEEIIQEPAANCAGHCPACGALGLYKPQGRVKKEHEIESGVYIADKYHDRGVVLRYIDVYKVYRLATDRNGKMTGAFEQMQGIETARTYFEPGKKVHTDFCKGDPYTGKDYWDDCNLYGMNNIIIGDGMIHPDTWKNLQGTVLQYSAIREYAEEKGRINAKEYLTRYTNWPQMEMLVRMKLFGVVDRMVKGYCGFIADENAKRPEDFLGIRKERMKLLKQHGGDVKFLELLQLEKRTGQNWTEVQIEALAELNADNEQLTRTLRIITAQKLINYISGYAGCGYGTGCSSATARLRSIAGIYFDYLDMRAQLGYDLANTVYQKPRDLMAAHNRMAEEINEKELDERLRTVALKYPEIRRHYRKLKKQYFYQDDEYVIRPAESAEEIVMEGRTLHHCVGGDTYLDKHNTGRSIILLLRFRSDPDMPYITAEIRGTTILQWHGDHDKKPDKKHMEEWLAGYTGVLECRRNGTVPQTGQETMPLAAGQ